MKRTILFLPALLFVVSFSYSQGEMDALRYSRNDLTGTARAMSMGGAFGALGGDITGVAINPAGIGVYRSSEIVGTMNFENISTETQLRQTTTDSRFKFNFDNIGYIGYYPSGDLMSFNLGFSYSRLKNYNRKYTAHGSNMPASLTDYAVIKTNRSNTSSEYLKHPDLYSGVTDDPFYDMPWLSVLSYNAGLIRNPETGTDPSQYESVLNDGDLVNNTLSISEKGLVASYDFTLGANLSDVLSLGITLSITDLEYSMNTYYSETFPAGSDFFMENWLRTDGTGYGLKIGTILRPADALRIGVSYHSPTWYTMSDRFEATIDYSAGNWVQSPKDNIFDYRLQTPYKWNFSIAGILGTAAIVSVDYELTDYKSIKLSTIDGGYDQGFRDHNGYMKDDLKRTSSIRTGLELRLTPQVSTRLGYAWVETPINRDVYNGNLEIITSGSIPHFALEGDTHYYTIGLGYRFTRNFYMDFAMVAKQQKDKVYAFSSVFKDDVSPQEVLSTPADMKIDTFKGLLTFGYKF
jgi:hypothetical protein